MLMDDPRQAAETSDPPTAAEDRADALAAPVDAEPEAPAGPPPVQIGLDRRGKIAWAVLAVMCALGLGWVALGVNEFNSFQRLVAGLFAAVAAFAAVIGLRIGLDQGTKLVIDGAGVHDLRSKVTMPWADLRRAWVIDSASGPMLGLEPIAGAGPHKTSLLQKIRRDDAALGFPPVALPLAGLAIKPEALLAAIAAHKPDAVLG
jgi:hypothetical protein